MNATQNYKWISAASDMYKYVKTISGNSFHKQTLINLLKKEWISNPQWNDKKNYYELFKSNNSLFDKISRLIFNKHNVLKHYDYYDEISPLKSKDLGYSRIIGMIWKIQLDILLAVKLPNENITIITENDILSVSKKNVHLITNNLSNYHVGVYMYKDYDDNIIIILFDVALSKIEDLISVLGID